MKKMVFGIFSVGVIAAIVYIALSNSSGAKDKIAANIAQDICGSIKTGMRMDQVSALAKSKQAWFRAYAPDGVRVGANGWYLNCRCNVLFKDGAVSSVSKSVCID